MGHPSHAALASLAILVAHAAPALGQDARLDRALRKFDADLAIVTEPGLVVRGDFNADSREDVAAIVHGPERSSFVIFHASADGYQINPLYTNLPDGAELRLVEPGRHKVIGPQRSVSLDSPAVELIFPGRSSAMYVWRRYRYQVYGTERF